MINMEINLPSKVLFKANQKELDFKSLIDWYKTKNLQPDTFVKEEKMRKNPKNRVIFCK